MRERKALKKIDFKVTILNTCGKTVIPLSYSENINAISNWEVG